MARKRMSANPMKAEAAGIYAGMDCCCSAGSIAISNEVPLWSDFGKGSEFSVAYGRRQAAQPTGWSYLLPSSLSCPAALSSETQTSSRGPPRVVAFPRSVIRGLPKKFTRDQSQDLGG